MQKEIFDKIISFLLGASWAIMLFGALVIFKLFIFFGFAVSLFLTIFFIVVSFTVSSSLLPKEEKVSAKKEVKKEVKKPIVKKEDAKT